MNVTGECYFISAKQNKHDEYYICLSDRTNLFNVIINDEELWQVCSELPVGTPLFLIIDWLPGRRSFKIVNIEIIKNNSDRLNAYRMEDI